MPMHTTTDDDDEYKELLRGLLGLAAEMDADVVRLRATADQMATEGRKGRADGLRSKANTVRHFSNQVRALLWERRDDLQALGLPSPRRQPDAQENVPDNPLLRASSL